MTTSERLSREDWIVEALQLIDAEGIHAIRVERLAEALGVTKGSFYWHFKDHDDLLRSMLQFWGEELPARIQEDMAQQPRDPSERLLWLLERIAEDDLNQHDRAIRAWALFDPAAKKLLRRVDADRLEYVRGLFVEMGFDRREAEMRSRTSYYYVIGEQVTLVDQTPATRMEHVRARHALLTTPVR